MAGETSKTVVRTARDSDIKSEARLSKGKLVEAVDYHSYLTTELELADALLTEVRLPSNAIISEVLLYVDDLDTNATETLAMDFGLYAVHKFTSVTSGTKTIHAKDSVLDADLLVDGDITAQDGNTKSESLALDAATAGPDDLYKAVWELLGYDVDPHTEFGLVVTCAVAAATAAAGDAKFTIRYAID